MQITCAHAIPSFHYVNRVYTHYIFNRTCIFTYTCHDIFLRFGSSFKPTHISSMSVPCDIMFFAFGVGWWQVTLSSSNLKTPCGLPLPVGVCSWLGERCDRLRRIVNRDIMMMNYRCRLCRQCKTLKETNDSFLHIATQLLQFNIQTAHRSHFVPFLREYLCASST